MNLYHTGLSELYKEVEALDDPLTGISDSIDFESSGQFYPTCMGMTQRRVKDPMMRAEEESSIQRDVASPRKDMEYFEDKRDRPGVFAIISDLDRNPSEIYGQYKSGEEVEQAFDTMKDDLESDRTYLRDGEKVKRFFLIVFLALSIRFKILNVLKDHNLLGKASVNDIIFELSKMERIVEKIVDRFSDIIPMGYI